MKKIFYILALAATTSMVACDQELLNTTPTDEVSAETLLSDAAGAQTAVNGIYAYMYQTAGQEGWTSENLSIMSKTLAFDVMGEDNYILGAGNQWYWYDHCLDVDGDYTRSYGRQGNQWSYYYQIISQVNYIIAKEDILVADGGAGMDVVAQAYAIRAFCYMNLADWFCLGNYAENSETAGVPLYLTPTSMDTKGQPRGTLADTYAQINADYKAAYDLFTEAVKVGATQSHISHIDLYSTCILWARTALAQGEWQRAYDLATEALTKPGLTKVVSAVDMLGFNDCSKKNVMWGFKVISDQTGPYGYFFSHIDPYNGSYCCNAELKCFSDELATSIPKTDERWAWIDTELDEDGAYVSCKFQYKNVATSEGDLILVRAEEAILIAAEAACRLKDWTNARALLTELGSVRDTAYADRLKALTDSELFNDDTTAALTPRTVMDEVLWQRRVELWCEGAGRTFDLKRLNLGYTRSIDGEVAEPGDYRFTLLIPQKEFDTNPAIKPADQNPR